MAESGCHDFADIPDDASFAVSLHCWAEAAAIVGDRDDGEHWFGRAEAVLAALGWTIRTSNSATPIASAIQ
jgi:hypothetical protein